MKLILKIVVKKIQKKGIVSIFIIIKKIATSGKLTLKDLEEPSCVMRNLVLKKSGPKIMEL